ncbi:MAG: hypothetical protein KC474_07850 [Cyanobacteria bacterium HKST-UBA04]|nr:hypothetical protein [Cyanobacteria bacterium HKST-UBA04]MCA9841407.1 hypothetical protein [Cyanobacteria bacterium HKST-UBA03]
MTPSASSPSSPSCTHGLGWLLRLWAVLGYVASFLPVFGPNRFYALTMFVAVATVVAWAAVYGAARWLGRDTSTPMTGTPMADTVLQAMGVQAMLLVMAAAFNVYLWAGACFGFHPPDLFVGEVISIQVVWVLAAHGVFMAGVFWRLWQGKATLLPWYQALLVAVGVYVGVFAATFLLLGYNTLQSL